MSPAEYQRAKERTTELMAIGERRKLTKAEHEEFTRLHERMCIAYADSLRESRAKVKPKQERGIH